MSEVAEVVDIEEEAAKHKDEWVLFEVTEVDEVDTPVKGRLLYHCKTLEELHREAMKHRDIDNYAFFTGGTPSNMIVVL